MAANQVSITREEADLLYDLLAEIIRDSTHQEPDARDRATWRLIVKLDRAIGDSYHPMSLFDDLPDHVRKILHNTFAPTPVPPKPKPTAKQPAPPVKKLAAKPAPVKKPAAPVGVLPESLRASG